MTESSGVTGRSGMWDPGQYRRFADERALELLGCMDGFELERLWERLKGRLEEAGLGWSGAGGGLRAVLDLPAAAGAEEPSRRRLLDLRRGPASGGGPEAAAGPPRSAAQW